MTEEQKTNVDKINSIQNIDVNNPDFYENVQCEIESDLARLKKNVEVVLNLRLAAAEVEVETAALYHAELFYDLLDIQNESEEESEEEDKTENGKDNNTDDEPF
ncbi:unnamed protein product [Arctia plantaginis]|uniref:Uncharacterized protein n=1 Tax=Arctia plantaginis TaxID=874455 RepID=A0A8S1AQ21_ARCPL|nr:unnamed protein product [Arctia plantaginis]